MHATHEVFNQPEPLAGVPLPEAAATLPRHADTVMVPVSETVRYHQTPFRVPEQWIVTRCPVSTVYSAPRASAAVGALSLR